jgi:hypothetical protein
MPRGTRTAAIVVLAAIVLAAVYLLVTGTTANGTHVVREEPLAYNLRYEDPVREIAPAPGEWLHLEGPDRESLALAPLELPDYEGDVGGVLPIVGTSELEALKQRFPDLEPVEEGKARINKVAGYTFAFRADRKQRLYGRLVLLPRPGERSGDEPAGRGSGTRTGVKMLLLATPDAGANTAPDVGARGPLKTPYRSFRFGTEGP